MKNMLSAIVLLTSMHLLTSCEKTTGTCQMVALNETFTAKIGEEWCLEGTDWKIEFGPFIEDSRCNVPGIVCVWEGRYVMGAAINNNGEILQDTFYAMNTWTDTLHHGYQVILEKIYPETRTSMEALDPSLYSFDVLIKN